MSGGSLTPLQRRILKALASFEPPWTLSGGAALVGFHLGHRTTRDLDLFWRDRRELGGIVAAALDQLHAASLEALPLRTAHAFSQIQVRDDAESCVVDLVAEPFPALESPVVAEIEGAPIAIDSRREILASKLAALLERSEVRDLADVKALVEAGADLETAVRDAPKKDAGFSPLTLAWVLEGYDLEPAAKALGLSEKTRAELDSFRKWLIDRLTHAAAPE